MFYKLKTNIINKSILKRNKNHSFNYFEAERFFINNNDDPLINNSYYFSAHEGDFSIFLRLGIRSNIIETWFVLLSNQDKYQLKEERYPDLDSSPIKVYLDDESNQWKIVFNGKVIHNNIEEVDLAFHATFHSEHRYLDFSTDMPSIRMAKAIGQEKWNKSFFDNLKNISGQTHYEQVGRLVGSYTINKNETKFDLACVRDHSFGKRDWDYMNNHLWLMAVSPSLDQFNYSLVSYPVISILEVGNYLKDHYMRYLISSDFDLSILEKGENLSSIKLKVLLDDHQEIEINAKVIDTTVYHFKNDKYTLIENIAVYEIENKKYKGILEVGFNSNKDRIFNGKDTKSLKR